MRRLHIAGAIACLLALTTATACAGATGQTAEAPSTAAAPYSAYSSGSVGGSGGSADSSNGPVADAARTEWLTKGGKAVRVQDGGHVFIMPPTIARTGRLDQILTLHG